MNIHVLRYAKFLLAYVCTGIIFSVRDYLSPTSKYNLTGEIDYFEITLKKLFLKSQSPYFSQKYVHTLRYSISELLSKWWKQCDLTQHWNVVMKRNNCHCSPEGNEINTEKITMVFAKVTITEQIRENRFFPMLIKFDLF